MKRNNKNNDLNDKKAYQSPQIQSRKIELGVYGNYDGDGDDGDWGRGGCGGRRRGGRRGWGWW